MLLGCGLLASSSPLDALNVDVLNADALNVNALGDDVKLRIGQG